MKQGERKPYGPRNKGGYSKIRQVTLDDNTVDVLRSFGDGNLSQGIRMAAAFIDDWQNNSGLPPPPPSVCHVL